VDFDVILYGGVAIIWDCDSFCHFKMAEVLSSKVDAIPSPFNPLEQRVRIGKHS
jgi:hypothetical protein